MKDKWLKENLEEIVKTSNTQKECLEKLGIRCAGGNGKTLKKYIDLYNLDTTHFNKNYDRMVELSKSKKIQTKDILTVNSTYHRSHLKERLYKEGLKERKCEMCGQDEEWNGKKMSLILDHINGIHNDNRLENLRIVCPNCNATLDTHCGKNEKKIKYYCECGNEKNKDSKHCKKCSSKKNRKVKERPSYERLKIEVKRVGYSATGRKYGVSDNTIRKWLKTYEDNKNCPDVEKWKEHR
jgi:hypothetical protein